MNFFDRINEWLDRTEVSWVNLLTKVLPILVPIIPAMQTKRHVVEVLGYGEVEGWIAAGIVEFFGYAAMYKMIQFAEHNRRYAERNRAPFGVAVAIYAAYLIIIIVFNVIPEVVTGKPAHVVWMNALFAVLSVPAGALTAISALHTERKEAMKRPQRTNVSEPERTSANEPQRTNSEPNRTNERTVIPMPANERTEPNEQPMGFPVNERKANILAYIEQVQREQNRTPGPSEIARELNVSKGYASDVMNGKA